ncbi:MAG: hypothetical protein EOP11_23610, partial [Proteobacteria bacterium]
VYTVGPDSHTLNPEYLPEWAQQQKGPSRFDELLAFSRGKTLPIVDLRPTLIAAKATHPVSYKTDSHWNTYGAFVAYQALMRYFRGDGAEIGEDRVRSSDLSFQPIDTEGMDLTVLAGLQSALRERSEQPKYSGSIRFDEGDRKGLHFTTHNPQGIPLTVICVCDSMAGNLYPYLARHFRTVRVMWGYPFDIEEMKRYKPDIIIQLVIERTLAWTLKDNPSEVRAALKR